MAVRRTSIVRTDLSQFVADTVEYEGKWWIVPNRLEGPTANTRCPARIICTDDLGLTKAPASSQFDYVLASLLDRAVLEGRRVTQSPFVIPRPDIILKLDTDFHRC